MSDHPFKVLEDAIWNSGELSADDITVEIENKRAELNYALLDSKHLTSALNNYIQALAGGLRAGNRILTQIGLTDTELNEQEKESRRHVVKLQREMEQLISERQREIEKGRSISLAGTKVGYEKIRCLRIWMFGINNFAWRYLFHLDNVHNATSAEDALEQSLANVFGDSAPEWIWNMKLSADGQTAATRLMSEDKIASRFLETCLPRVEKREGRYYPSRSCAIESITGETYAAQQAKEEEKLYIKLENAKPDAVDEKEWTLCIFKRMLPIYIALHTNPLFDLSFWEDAGQFDYVSEKLTTALSSREYEAYHLNETEIHVLLHKNFQNQEDNYEGFQNETASVCLLYDQAYGRKNEISIDELRSVEIWSDFPSCIQKKAILVWNVIVPAAMDNHNYFLRENTGRGTLTPRVEQRNAQDNGMLCFEYGNVCLFAREDQQSKFLVQISLFSDDIWKPYVICRNLDGFDSVMRTDQAQNFNIVSLAEFGRGDIISRVHCMIDKQKIDAVGSYQLVLKDYNSTNGTAVFRDGVCYIVGAGKDNKLLYGNEEALRDGRACDKTKAQNFPLRRCDRIFLGVNSDLSGGQVELSLQ